MAKPLPHAIPCRCHSCETLREVVQDVIAALKPPTLTVSTAVTPPPTPPDDLPA